MNETLCNNLLLVFTLCECAARIWAFWKRERKKKRNWIIFQWPTFSRICVAHVGQPASKRVNTICWQWSDGSSVILWTLFSSDPCALHTRTHMLCVQFIERNRRKIYTCTEIVNELAHLSRSIKFSHSICFVRRHLAKQIRNWMLFTFDFYRKPNVEMVEWK